MAHLGKKSDSKSPCSHSDFTITWLLKGQGHGLEGRSHCTCPSVSIGSAKDEGLKCGAD